MPCTIIRTGHLKCLKKCRKTPPEKVSKVYWYMLLNVKNKKFQFVCAVFFALLLLNACKGDNKTAEEINLEKKREADSLARLRQRRQGDSLKKTNPLLIVPPDSSYTGDYVDKYPAGIIKFKGFF